MPRRGYPELYEAIQEAFEPEDMTESRIQEWLVHGDTGKHTVKWGEDKKGKQRYREVEGGGVSPGSRRLARKLAETSKTKERIDKADSIADLDELFQEARDLAVHGDTLTEEINMRRAELVTAERIARKELEDKSAAEFAKTQAEINEVQSEEEELTEELEGLEEQRKAIEKESPEEAAQIERKIESDQKKINRLTTQRQQLEAKQKKEKLRAEGIEPDF